MPSTQGRHRRARSRRLAVIAGGLLPAMLVSYAAYAAVAPAPVASTNGNSGFDSHLDTSLPANAAGFSDVQSVVTGGQYGLGVKAGAQGVQLCVRAPAAPAPAPTVTSTVTPTVTPTATPTSTVTPTPAPTVTIPGRPAPADFAAQVGLVSDNLKTTYSVASAVGVLPGTGCPTGGVLSSPVTFPALTAVPYGHRVWVDTQLNRHVRHIHVLICILRDRGPLATQTPLAPDQPVPSITPRPGLFPGFHCFFRVITRPAATVTFSAQDLDAPTTIPVTGDLPGVQTRTVRVPSGTVFTDAGAGVNEDTATLVACSGNGYPKTLAGPAAYVSAACQPISAFDHTTATVGTGTAQALSALDTTEGIAPSGTSSAPALVAPNNSLATTPSTTPPGTASNASAGGDSFTEFTANLPTS